MIVILHLVDALEFARMVFINPLPEASNIRLLEYDSNFTFEQFILRRVIVAYSRERIYNPCGDKRKIFPRRYTATVDITVCHNHTDNRSICPDYVEIVFHCNRFLVRRLDWGSFVVVLLYFATRYSLIYFVLTRDAA